MDLALDNQQRLICHRIQPTNQPTNYFLDIEVVYPESGKIWIGQSTNTAEILKKFQMENSKLTTTTCDAGTKLTKVNSDNELFVKEVYQSAIGNLLYLSTRTRSDIAYAVGIVARFSS